MDQSMYEIQAHEINEAIAIDTINELNLEIKMDHAALLDKMRLHELMVSMLLDAEHDGDVIRINAVPKLYEGTISAPSLFSDALSRIELASN